MSKPTPFQQAIIDKMRNGEVLSTAFNYPMSSIGKCWISNYVVTQMICNNLIAKDTFVDNIQTYYLCQ